MCATDLVVGTGIWVYPSTCPYGYHDDFALMMEAALGINPELLINMQSRYNMSVARQKKSLIAKLLDIKRACAAIF